MERDLDQLTRTGERPVLRDHQLHASGHWNADALAGVEGIVIVFVLPACLLVALPLPAQGVEARHRLQPEADFAPTLADGIEGEAGIVKRPRLLQLREVVRGEIGPPTTGQRRIDKLLLHVEPDSPQRYPGPKSKRFSSVFSGSSHIQMYHQL